MSQNQRFSLILLIIALFLLLFLTGIGTASAETWYVDDDGGTDFIRIQDAIDNATSGDTIIVKDGTYHENVKVNKALTIMSENGAVSTTVMAAHPYSHVFEVTAYYVNISGFSVKNATEFGMDAEICLNRAYFCNISDNNVSNNNNLGVYLTHSSNNTITNNTANFNDHGIYLEWSSNNTITNNTANFNKKDGISLRYSNNNILTNNTASNNLHGIYLDVSSNNNIYNNTANSNGGGIYLDVSSNNNIITANTANSNNENGIYLKWSSNNNIYNNTASSNKNNGINLWRSEKNIITINTANLNNRIGIYLDVSWNNNVNGNTANLNGEGIHLEVSSNNNIYNNTANSNACGIYLDISSNNNIITGNTANSNNNYDIYLASHDNKITNNEGTFYRVWILTNTRLMVICLLTLVLLLVVLKRIMSPEVERGIGLGLLTSGALFFVLIDAFYKIPGRINIIQFSPDLQILYYFSVIIMVIIGLIIGIFLGMAFKWSKFRIKYWSIVKKILIVFVAFNLGGICTNIFYKEPPLYIAYIYYNNISALISISILAVYEGAKRRWVRSHES